MKKAVIAYLLAALLISLIGLSVVNTVADGDSTTNNQGSSRPNITQRTDDGLLLAPGGCGNPPIFYPTPWLD